MPIFATGNRSGRVVYMYVLQMSAVHLLKLLRELLKISLTAGYYRIRDRVGIKLGVAVAG